MEDLARNLINLNRKEAVSNQLSVITGSAGDLARNLSNLPGARIGFWPIISESHTKAALGITTLVSLLLERWSEVTVYRLLAAVEGDPDQYDWRLKNSQFTVEDDWELEGLDDNIGLWGTLQHSGSRWVLTLQIENDLDEKDTIEDYSIEADSLKELVNKLPATIEKIIEATSINQERVFEEVYPEVQCDDELLTRVLYSAFEWELMLYFALWGRGGNIKEAHTTLIEQCQSCGEFGTWLASAETARTFLPGFSELTENIIPVENVVEIYPESRYPRLYLSRALYDYGEAKKAFELLEEEIELRPQYPVSWRTLANIYSRSGRVTETLDTLQGAVEEEAINAQLLTAYAQYLFLIDAQGWNVEEFVFIDPDNVQDRPVLHEIVGAYDKALTLNPKNYAAVLAQKIHYLAELSEIHNLWDAFQQLIEVDLDGTHTRAVIDDLYQVDDIAPGIDIFHRAIKTTPERADLYINLAALYIMDEQGDEAAAHLEHARSITQDEFLLNEIDRLALMADDPDFEIVMGEITDKIGAQSRLDDDEIEYLEDIVAEVPKYTEAYILLAKAYMLDEDTSAALETLLDAEKHITDEPEIFELLASVLWESNERELAFQYINRGLKLNQTHVPLLALAGRFLFDQNEDDAARAYLARAEGLAPNHPALLKVRKYIASQM